MRTLGFRTHVLMAIAAAAGMVLALGLPWYAVAPRQVDTEKAIGDINGPLDGFFRGVERWVTESSGATAWQALDQLAVAMAALAGLAALGALVCMLPALQGVGREVLRYAAFAAFALAFWKLIDPPGSNGATELRYGAFLAVAAATVMLTTGMGVANAPLRARTRKVAYAPPPPPAPLVESAAPAPTASVPPPGR